MGMTCLCLARSGPQLGEGFCLMPKAQCHMISCSLTHCRWAGRTQTLGQPTGVSTLDLLECLISSQPRQFTCKFKVPRATVLVNKAEAALGTMQCHSHYCHHVRPLVTSQSHTCAHSRGVDIGSISQLEERQGHIVKAGVCELEDSCSYF